MSRGAPRWAAEALDDVLTRVAATHREVGPRFPLFADPDSGRWTTSARGSWTGGFWAGLLWLRARHSGEAAHRAAAGDCTARLGCWVEADTATRGLIHWYGTALADDARSAALRERAARACLAAYDPRLGLVPWGGAFGGPRLVARVDGVPGMVPLLATVDERAAASHLRTHLELCGVDLPAWEYGPGRWVACEAPPPGWSRGRAWLLLALADRPAQLPYVLDALMPDRLVPLADASRPDGPLDTSAAAITALALLKLGRREQAMAVLEELVHGHLAATGRLLDGCYDLDAGTAVRHELVWGTFFLAAGLAVVTGLLDARAV
ncbi:hypothetical protein [Streptomyces purpureus]|uniref:hypothetical protein n=1 Tax=Streptomyces purpureus TaxID=1951 RepID=UPI0003A74AA4|nr:hypothetical protein [Streptomyces purpureus]